jgi:hypothetical protein
MTAGVNQILFCLFRNADLCQRSISRMRFAKVRAKPALSLFYVKHGSFSFDTMRFASELCQEDSLQTNDR